MAAQQQRPTPKSDNFLSLIRDVVNHIPPSRFVSPAPSENELREWNTILQQYRRNSIDSCKTLMAKYNYSFLKVTDNVTKNSYDVFKENYPIQRGWGTFVFNRNHTKRLYIHVNHPIEDDNAPTIGAELFRQLNAEWLLIAGTRKSVVPKQIGDLVRLKRTVFHRWHESLTDLTHLTLSLHGYPAGSYPSPIDTTDIIVSNGRTTDEQWGISQISLAFRDSMRAHGMKCSLAMYDSGFSRLSGSLNPQGIFSNDSVGFGHWLYVELSNRVRYSQSNTTKFVTAANHALDLTGKKISQQVNRAFGLVSPRIVRLDSLHRIFFPPTASESYRIVSFNTRTMRQDTIDLRMGNWLELGGSGRTVASVTVIDTSSGTLDRSLSHTKRNPYRNSVAKIINSDGGSLSSTVRLIREDRGDSTFADEDREKVFEPIQVHRIPLQAVVLSQSTDQLPDIGTAFRWDGVISGKLTTTIPTFEFGAHPSENEMSSLPRFLIPIINSSYRSGKSKFVGVQMTTVLVKEIARLVTEHQAADKDVGLLAEQSERGDYYLRIFPGSTKVR
jgi:hypothetical protein